MSKFNTITKTKTINLAGGQAYKVNDKFQLVGILLTSFVQSQFYRSEQKLVETVKGLVSSIKDKLFIAKAAIFARNEFGMRSVSHLIAGEIAKEVKGENWTKKFFSKVVRRVDDITEIMSYYLANYEKPVPNSLKKGLANALNKFDGYQLAKYRGAGKSLSLVDVFNLIHPRPQNGNAKYFKSLIDGTLKSTDTWESKLSNAGKTEDKEQAKADAWKELILEKKIGYFALLRNLRNIEQQAPELIDKACELLVEPRMIKKSLVLPFRFTTAYKEVSDRRFLIALNQAIDISCNNVPDFHGKTCVVLDESGSMNGKPWETGSLFAAILVKSCNADLITFSNQARYQKVNPMDSVITIKNNLSFACGGTNLSSALQIMDKAYDRIIILSDMQTWLDNYFGASPMSAFRYYKTQYSITPYIYSWDLQSYGTIQFPEDKIFLLAGWSEKVFDIMNLLEQDKNALIKRIEEIEI